MMLMLYFYQQLLSDKDNALLVLSPGPGSPQKQWNDATIAAVAQHILLLSLLRSSSTGSTLWWASDSSSKGGSLPIKPSNTYSNRYIALASPLIIARYHSLITNQIPECLDVIASTDGIPMAIQHKTLPIIGFQFHPESISPHQKSITATNYSISNSNTLRLSN